MRLLQVVSYHGRTRTLRGVTYAPPPIDGNRDRRTDDELLRVVKEDISRELVSAISKPPTCGELFLKWLNINDRLRQLNGGRPEPLRFNANRANNIIHLGELTVVYLLFSQVRIQIPIFLQLFIEK